MTANRGTKAQCIKVLEELTQEPGFIYSFAMILAHDFFVDPEEAADIDWRERLSFQEACFVAGLMVKRELPPLTILPPAEHDGQVTRLKGGLTDLQAAYNEAFPARLQEALEASDSDPQAQPLGRGEFYSNGELMAEPIFYGGSGAYDFQYTDFAVTRYEMDREWLLKNRGLGIEDVAQIHDFLKALHTDRYRSLQAGQSFASMTESILGLFTFDRETLSSFHEDSVEAFLRCFSIVPGTVNEKLDDIGAYNAVNSHPVIHLPNGRFFLPVAFQLSESLYESPFYWMLRDHAYRTKAAKHRGDVTERIAQRLLEPVFGKENVYADIQVHRSSGEKLTDIDVLAVRGNRAVIVQAKSKRLTELARRGNPAQLKSDFKAAIQDAYDQGLICRRALLDRSAELRTSTGELIELPETLRDAYILCVSSDHYPAVVHQLGVFLDRPSDAPAPLAVSLFDLDLMSAYLTDPFEFLYYLRQRVALSDHYQANSEAAYLGWHMRQKLFRDEEVDLVVIDEQFAQLIDANFPSLRGHVPKTEAMERLFSTWRNPGFSALLFAIKANASASFTDAIFLLYDFAGNGADVLLRNFAQVKERALADGKGHDFTALLKEGKLGVTLLAMPLGSDVSARLMSFCMARKYKAKADEWLGFAWVIGSANIVDAAVYNREPWEFDMELDRLAKLLVNRGRAVDARGKDICPTDPCLCGSGKQFQHCCAQNL